MADLAVTTILFLLVILGIYFIYSLMFSTPFYPSRTKKLNEAFDKLGIKFNADTKFIDLGSGDGRTVIWAAKKGMRAYGIDENPYLTLFSKFKANTIFRKYRKNITIMHGSFYKHKLNEYDIVYLYIYNEHMAKLKDKIFSELKPGSIVLSNTFTFKNLEPDSNFERFYVYKVK